MDENLYSLADWIVRSSSREHPADAVMRQELKAQRALSTLETAQVSRAVFSYYRWKGWLNLQAPLSDQIQSALDYADRFSASPGGFTDAELIQRVGPGWLGEEMSVTPAWARAIQGELKLWLRARRGQGMALAARLGDCRFKDSSLLGDTIEYRGKLDLFRSPEFHGGEFEIQDISSQAVGLVCAPKARETWWDACAGEGGKMLHLSELMENRGLIWATERAAWRLQRLRRRAARAKVFNYRAASWDGGPRLPTKTKFDGVLIDAPCSGLGTWQRNPHARWTTTKQDIQELAGLQLDLLTHAAKAVKPGGRLVYAVCTVTRTETEAVADAFEESAPAFKPLALRDPLAAKSSPTNRLTLWPYTHGGNGMFIAAWVRVADTSK